MQEEGSLARAQDVDNLMCLAGLTPPKSPTSEVPPGDPAAMLMNLTKSVPIANPKPCSFAVQEYVPSHVDEHTPLVYLARTQVPGSTLYIEAGAGAGKTTLAEHLISSGKINQFGQPRQIIATTMTKAGVHALKGRRYIPSALVRSLHSLGYDALCKAYVHKMKMAIQKTGGTCGQTADEIRLPVPHASKYLIMCQQMMPPTQFDKEANMHSPDVVSAAYTLLSEFMIALANKAMEAGFGQPGQPLMNNLEALLPLSQKGNLDGILEKHYHMLSFEQQPLCNRSAAVIHKCGPTILASEFLELQEAIDSFTPGFEFSTHVTATTRLHAGLIMTSHLLQEGMKAAMRPVWRGASCFVNALDNKDILQFPASTFSEMVGLPPNPSIRAPVLARNGKPYDLILIDEAQDSNPAQVGLILWSMAPLTQLIVIGDPLQRCYSFASASAQALQALLAPRPLGVVTKCRLSNNFRSAQLICDVIQNVLTDDVGSDRIIRPVRAEKGEVLYRANLRNGVLQKWVDEGTVAILARLNSVLATFQAYFLTVGQPFAVLGRQGVLPQLLRLLEPFNEKMSMSAIVMHLKGTTQNQSKSVEQRDHALCVMIFASSLLPDTAYQTETSPKNRLYTLLETAYAGSSTASENSKVRGMPILGNGHASKGHEFNTVILAEPGSAMIQAIIERGGEEAEDETHLKHVLVSRSRDRLVFLDDVFKEHGPKAIVALCTPLTKSKAPIEEVPIMKKLKKSAVAAMDHDNSADMPQGEG